MPPPPPYSATVQNPHIDMQKADSSQRAKVSAQTTTTPTTQRKKPPHSLVDLPDGVLLEIKAYLAPEFRAALALTNRHLLRTVGADTTLPVLSPIQRDAFLRLLHRDLETDIYCIPCGKLHHYTRCNNNKQCPDTIVRDVPGGSTRRFPLYPPFAVVRALMRDTRVGRRPHHTGADWETNKWRSHIKIDDADGKSWEEVEFKADRNMSCPVIKYHFSWRPLAARPCAAAATTQRAICQLGWTHSQITDICRHRRWRDEYPFVFPRSIDTCSDRWEMDPRLECALRHPWDCTCAARTWAGRVRGCTECHTDYCLALAPVPITGIFVFTVWKNVGPGGEFHDPFYKSHLDLESARPSSAPPGNHCFAFEQRWLGSDFGVYVPYQAATPPDKSWIRHGDA